MLCIFLAASIGDVSDCNQFLQERSCSCVCSNTRASTHGGTLRLNTPEKASDNMLETHVNSHCNATIIGYFYQLDVELCSMLVPW